MRKKKGLPGHDYSRGFKSDDLPATQGLVNALRLELNSKITSLELQTKAEFAVVNSRLLKIEAKLEEMMGLMAQMHANNEKQRNENRIVLDTLSLVLEQNDQTKKRLNILEGI